MDYTQISKQARASMRDSIICMLIGLQNDIGHHKSDTVEYQTIQKVMNCIEEYHGELMGELKS